MKLLRPAITIVANLFLFATVVPAQSPTSSSPFYSADQYKLAHSLFYKLSGDLALASTGVASRDAARFIAARQQLEGLVQHWDNGIYYSRDADSVVSAIRSLSYDGALLDKDRDSLDSDLSQLLDFRAEYYGTSR